MSHKPCLLLWDEDSEFVKGIYDVVCWRSYLSLESDGIFSIPQIVEKRADKLKAKFLRLIYELGESKVNGKRIINHLLIRQDFSYWWLTLFVEKCNYAKSPQIDNIIKLMAFEDWLHENKYHKLKLVSSNYELAESLTLLAKKLKIDFEWEKKQSINQKKGFLKRVFHTLPDLLKPPIWLVYHLICNWPLRGVGVKEWKTTTANSTFVSYLFNLEPEAEKKGQFNSHYWTTLTKAMNDKEHSSNWLHIYIKNDLLTSAKKARNLICKFNQSHKGSQVHVTLSSFLTISVIVNTLKDWLKVLKFHKLISKKIIINCGYLWPLFKKDYQDSMSGVIAINSLLDFNLFEKAMIELPIQNRGCYLQENMSWEFGFIYAWKSAGHHKNLLGFPSSAVIYWDLRRFFDTRLYKRKGLNDLPLPNYVGVNGDVSKSMYLDGGYPKEDLIEVESLRYLYLSDFSHNSYKKERKVSKEKVILIVGDYLHSNTCKQLNVLKAALEDIEQPVQYIIKPHPSCPVDINNFPGLNAELSDRPIGELMKRSDIIYSSLITSAAIDGYCAGLPVITLLDGKTLNVSPLRRSEGVYFIRDSKDLAIAINTTILNNSNQGSNYFYLDSDLPRWHNWLVMGSDNDKKEFRV
jgi:surface carbohydrate biosynthesis protein (TIGR04326 family)